MTFILCNTPAVLHYRGALLRNDTRKSHPAEMQWLRYSVLALDECRGINLMKYCPECGMRLEERWISSDGRERLLCVACDVIRYENPRILVALMLTCGDRLLLCRRAHQPSQGTWTPPSGFMERGETLERAAVRETFEETGVQIDPETLALYTVSSLPTISEVYVVFRAVVESDGCRPGSESLEVGYFNEQAVPWNELAYAEMTNFLRQFFHEHREQKFGIHMSRIEEHGRFHREYRLVTRP